MSKIIKILLILTISFGNLNALTKTTKNETNKERRSTKTFNKRMSLFLQSGLNTVEGHNLLTASIGIEALKYFSPTSDFSYGGRGYISFVGTDNESFNTNNSLGIFLNVDGKINYNITSKIDTYYVLGLLYGRDYNIENKFGLNNAIGFGYEVSNKFYLSTEYSYKMYFGDVQFLNDSSYLFNINMKY
jgi:hypothetical protein